MNSQEGHGIQDQQSNLQRSRTPLPNCQLILYTMALLGALFIAQVQKADLDANI